LGNLTFSVFGLGRSQEASHWECLEELNKFIPVTRLELATTPQNFEHLVRFAQNHPNITYLDMGKSSEIEDQHLNELALYLPNINAFFIKNAKIKTIPDCITSKVKELECYLCTELTTLTAEAAEWIHCADCTSLTELTANAAKVILCQDCTALTKLTAKAALAVICNRCCSLVTLTLNAVVKLYCYDCTSLKTLIAKVVHWLNCDGLTALETLEAPKKIIDSLDREKFPSLKLL